MLWSTIPSEMEVGPRSPPASPTPNSSPKSSWSFCGSSSRRSSWFSSSSWGLVCSPKALSLESGLTPTVAVVMEKPRRRLIGTWWWRSFRKELQPWLAGWSHLCPFWWSRTWQEPGSPAAAAIAVPQTSTFFPCGLPKYRGRALGTPLWIPRMELHTEEQVIFFGKYNKYNTTQIYGINRQHI